MSLRTSLGAVAATVGGRALEAAVVVLARSRRAAKPMHPLGHVCVGRLTRRGGCTATTGSAFLDEPGDDEALVRLSRSAGLPVPWPDVNGLAVRVPTADGGHGDLLLSTTGRGRLTRYLLTVSRSDRGGHFSTLVPYRTPSGPVHVGASCAGSDRFRLLWARPGGDWHAFAELTLSPDPGRDLDVSFDAVVHTLDGLASYDWYRRLRAPSYAAARRLRGAELSPVSPGRVAAPS